MTAPAETPTKDDLYARAFDDIDANLTHEECEEWAESMHEAMVRKPPTLTTEQARGLASRWAAWKTWADVRGGLGQYDAEYEGPWDPHGEEGSERDRLETWVRARMVAHLEGWQDSHETAAAYLAAFPEARCDVAGELADDLSWDHEGPDEDTPAWALCVAAGWP